MKSRSLGFGVSFPVTGGIVVRHLGAGHQYFPTRKAAAQFFRDTANWIDNDLPSLPWWKKLLGVKHEKE